MEKGYRCPHCGRANEAYAWRCSSPATATITCEGCDKSYGVREDDPRVEQAQAIDDAIREAKRRREQGSAQEGSKTDAVRRACADAGVPVIERRLTEVEERDLAGIPVMDEDELVSVAPPARGSAPVSVRGRVALACEMMHRAMMELDTAIAEGEDGEAVRIARGHAYAGFVELDKPGQ